MYPRPGDFYLEVCDLRLRSLIRSPRSRSKNNLNELAFEFCLDDQFGLIVSLHLHAAPNANSVAVRKDQLARYYRAYDVPEEFVDRMLCEA